MAPPRPTAGTFAVFSDVASAMGAVGDMRSAMLSHGSNRPNLRQFLLHAADRFGAIHTNVSKRSSVNQRETLVYGYQDYIPNWDREYLVERDPTANLLCFGVARDAAATLPTHPTQEIQSSLYRLGALGLPAALQRALAWSRRDGTAFLYINAPGALDTPIPQSQPGSRLSSSTPLGFGAIPLSQVDANNPVVLADANSPDPSISDPLALLHGIAFLQHTPEGLEPRPIHGSRIHPIVTGITASWLGQSVIDPIFDDLRNLRDVTYAHSNAHLQGNPIVVSVDWENGFRLDDDGNTAVDSEMQEFASGTRHSFSPLYGVTVSRLGPTDVGDPEPIVRLLLSRISQPNEVPVNMLYASSKGSIQVTGDDYTSYETNLHNRIRVPNLEPSIRHVLLAMARAGGLPRRTASIDGPLFTEPFAWSPVRLVSARDLSLNWKDNAMAVNMALKVGRLPPKQLQLLFPTNTEPIDPLTCAGGKVSDQVDPTESAIAIADAAPTPAPARSNDA